MAKVGEVPLNVDIDERLDRRLADFLVSEGTERPKKLIVATAVYYISGLKDEQLIKLIREMKAKYPPGNGDDLDAAKLRDVAEKRGNKAKP
jgi:hypothetical protein